MENIFNNKKTLKRFFSNNKMSMSIQRPTKEEPGSVSYKAENIKYHPTTF